MMADKLINLDSVYGSGRIKRQLVEEMLGKSSRHAQAFDAWAKQISFTLQCAKAFFFFSFLILFFLESGVHFKP